MSDLNPTTVSPPALNERQVVTDPTSENIAAFVDNRFYLGDLALPQTIDEAERVYGREIYERMSHDANLAAAVRFIKAKVLKGGLSVQPVYKAPSPDEPDSAKKAESQAKHDQSVECADFVTYCLKQLRKPGERIMDVIGEMLDCIYTGNRLAEINTAIATTGPYAGDRVLVSVRPKPKENYAFVVHSLGGLVGVCAVVPGVAPFVRQGIIYDPASLPNMISSDKVMVFRFGGKNGDPRGESCFRDAYDAWLDRQSLKVKARRIDDSFAGGRLSAKIDVDAQGEISPAVIASDLSKWQSNGVFVGPKGVEATVHEPNIDPAWFAFRDRTFREEMVMAVIVNARQILAAEKGSEKDSGVAQDAGEDVMDAIRDLAQACVDSQLFYSLCLWKWGKEIADEYCPKAVFGSAIRPDFAANMTALGAVGYTMDPSTFAASEEAVGAPVRRPDWQQVADERAKTDQEAQAKMAAAQPKEKTFRRAGQPKKAA